MPVPIHCSRKQVLAEIFLIFAVFFAHGAWPVPDVNEPYYLGKAIHFWNPSSVPGDFFLETADTHEVFYITFGWLALWLSPTALAWTGRLLTWALMAWAWRRMSHVYLPRRWAAVLSAAVFVCLLEHCHMAGEWVIGGVEAKGFAFVLVFLALEAVGRNRWNFVWLLLGAASAFHVLVGGWSVVAAALAWATLGKERPRLGSMALALVGGFFLSLLGLVPALNLTTGADSQTVAQAYRIYVFGRLGHHLSPAFIPWSYVYRFIGLVVLWVLLERFTPADDPRRRLRRFVGAAIGVAIVGMAISLFVRLDQTRVAALLRFYWFRLSDVAVPLGVAMVVGPFAAGWFADFARRWSETSRLRRGFSLGVMTIAALGVLTTAIGLVGVLLRLSFSEPYRVELPWAFVLECGALIVGGLFFLAAWSLPLPSAIRRLWLLAPICTSALLIFVGTGLHVGGCVVSRLEPTIPRADQLHQFEKHEDRLADYQAWRKACEWVATSGQIPRDARFLTPRVSQTFKWYTGRAEVVNWKEVPQDPQSIVQWWYRLNDIFATPSDSPAGRWYDALGQLGADRLRQLGEKYDADYVITWDWPQRHLGLEEVYRDKHDPWYVIYRLHPSETP